MFVSIQDSDIDVLRVIARRSDKIVGTTVFPGASRHDLRPDQIAGLLANHVKLLNIRVMWWKLPDSIHALHVSLSDTLQIIGINDIFRGDDEQWENMRDVKPLVLHELAHIVQEHPAAYVPPIHDEGAELAQLRMLYSMIMHHAMASHEQFENEAEVFAAALGFWPGNLFWKQFVNTKGEFRRIANYFKMPVDCAVKWAVLSRPEHNIHYLKFNVSTNMTEDYHLPEHYSMPDDFPWDFTTGQVVHNPETAAGRCLVQKDDAVGASKTSSPHHPNEYWCYAFYEKVSASRARSGDKIVVGGFPRSIYDLLDPDGSGEN